jgi:DNA-binding CsgD family transcriptional regulator
VAPWTFIGRDAELRRLIDAATGRTARGVIFGGAQGVGKSRLLREAATHLDPRRHCLVTAVANAATATLPMASLAPVLPADQPGGASPAVLLRWALDALRRQASGRPVVLAIDDAHLLDPLSATLTHHVARAGDGTVLGTLRTGAEVPDPVRALWVDDLVDRFELAPLGRVETAELLQDVLGAPVDSASVGRLWRLSQGNVLLLRELVGAARAGDGLTVAYGVWRWNGGFALAPTLTDAVDARIGQLTPALREVLELVAFGEPIGLPLLVKATTVAAVEEAEERGLIAVERNQRRTTARVSHPLFGEVIRRRCPTTRVRRLLDDLACLTEAAGARRRGDLLRLAVWRLDSDTAHDPVQLLTACQQALARYDLPLAVRLGRAAVAAHGGVDAAAILAVALLMSGQQEAALAAVDGLPDDHKDARWHWVRAVISYWAGGDASTPDLLASEAARLACPSDRSDLRAVEAIMRLHRGEPAAAGRLASTVLDEPRHGPAADAMARSVRAHLLAAAGGGTRALAAVADVEAADADWRERTPGIRLAIQLARGTAVLLAGDLPAVDTIASAEFGGTGEFLLGSTYLMVLRSQAARMRGDLVEAYKLAAQACAVLDGAAGAVFAGLAHVERAHAAALMGDTRLAAEAMAEADRCQGPTTAVLYPWVEEARAWVAVAAGEPDEAVAILRRLVERLRRDKFHGHEVVAQLDLVRLGDTTDTAQRLRWLAGRTDGPLVTVAARCAEAVAGRDGVAALASAAEFEHLGMHLYGAEAAAMSVVLLRDARSPAAPRAAGALARMRGRCRSARTPALDVKQLGLTDRERQIACLAAGGVSSKEIADRLYLSPRTVDNHLMRVYAKLGVSGRAELTPALNALPREDA